MNYARLEDLKDALRGVDLSTFRGTEWAENTPQLDALLSNELEEAEGWVDGYCSQNFTPLSLHTDVFNGNGRSDLRVRNVPIFDLQQVTIRYNAMSPSITFQPQQFLLERKVGRVAFQPTVVMPFIPSGGPVFWIGKLNVIVAYRSGHAIVGNNIGLGALSLLGFEDIADVSTSGDLVTFRCPRNYGLFRKDQTVSTAPPVKMLKDGVDDSANWTMRTQTTLTCPTSAYASSSTYVFAYLPAAITASTVSKAASEVLTKLSSKSGSGAGAGAVSEQIGPFKNDYGPDGMYSAPIKNFLQCAKDDLAPFVRMR